MSDDEQQPTFEELLEFRLDAIMRQPPILDFSPYEWVPVPEVPKTAIDILRESDG